MQTPRPATSDDTSWIKEGVERRQKAVHSAYEQWRRAPGDMAAVQRLAEAANSLQRWSQLVEVTGPLRRPSL